LGRLLLLLLLLAAGGLAACGGDGPDTASVDVFLSEWEVSPEAGLGVAFGVGV